MATKKDIAMALGVSRGSVSQVLNHTPSCRVSPALRQRILDTARKLGYTSPAMQSAAHAHRSACLVYLLGWSYLKQRTSPSGWHLTLLSSIQQQALSNGQHVVFMGVNRLKKSIDDALAMLDNLQPRGVVVDGVIPPRIVRALQRRHWPWVVTGALPYAYDDNWEGKLSAVAPDNNQLMQRLITQLHRRGCRQVGLLLDSLDFYHNRLLFDAYQQALRVTGMTYHKAHVQIVSQQPGRKLTTTKPTDALIPDGLICSLSHASQIAHNLGQGWFEKVNRSHLAIFGNIENLAHTPWRDAVSINPGIHTFARETLKLLRHLTRHPGQHRRVLLKADDPKVA